MTGPIEPEPMSRIVNEEIIAFFEKWTSIW